MEEAWIPSWKEAWIPSWEGAWIPSWEEAWIPFGEDAPQGSSSGSATLANSRNIA